MQDIVNPAEQTNEASVEAQAPGNDTQLRRELGLFSTISTIVSVMIGSGIFISPSSALMHTGSVGLCLVVWTACGVISLLGALAFAELGTLVPKSGGEYAFLLESFSDKHKFWGPLPAFIYAWVSIMVLYPAGITLILLTFAEYAVQPFITENQNEVLLKKIVAAVALGVITCINLTSVKLYVKLLTAFATCKILACLIIITGGIYELCQGNTERLSSGFIGSNLAPGSIALAFYSGLWAYDGWASITKVTEEIRRPEINILRSILIAVPLVTILYIATNTAYLAVLDIPEMIASPAVAEAFAARALGPLAPVIPLGVAISTFGNALTSQFSTSRLCYVAAREGHMAEVLSFVHMKYLTPIPAVFMHCVISSVFISLGDIRSLLSFISFLLWFFYGTVMVSLLVMRRTKKDVHRSFKVPIVIPIFILLVAVFLCVMPIVSDPSPKYLFAVGFILSGIAVYTPLVYYKIRPAWIGKLTKLIQNHFHMALPQVTDVK